MPVLKLPTAQKPVEFVGSSRDDLRSFPIEVRTEMGHAIFVAQIGGKHPSAKPLTGRNSFKGAGVLEIVEDYDGDTFRAVYTISFKGAVYVLHAFQKKSKRRSQTPRQEIEIIESRLKLARAHHAVNYTRQATG
jgi:phage-related protein